MRSTIALSLAFIPLMLASEPDVPHLGNCYKPKGFTIPKIDQKELKCLATMVYGEARGEPDEGMLAVAYTAKNRAVKSSVCKVVLAPYQYSVFNDNPALRMAAMSLKVEPKQHNIIDKDGWNRSREAALIALENSIPDPTNGGTHYLAPIAMKALGYGTPNWAISYQKVAVIKNHVFFKERVAVIKIKNKAKA